MSERTEMGDVPVDQGGMTLRVLPEVDSDVQELAEWADQLLAELSEVDEASVAPLTTDTAPEGAKGLGTLAGQLVAGFATADGLRALVAGVRGWVARRHRTVEISIDGDVLKMTGVSSQQQEKVIDAWIAKHAPAA